MAATCSYQPTSSSPSVTIAPPPVFLLFALYIKNTSDFSCRLLLLRQSLCDTTSALLQLTEIAADTAIVLLAPSAGVSCMLSRQQQ